MKIEVLVFFLMLIMFTSIGFYAGRIDAKADCIVEKLRQIQEAE